MTLQRSFDIVDLVIAMYPYHEDLVGFDPEEWLNNQLNIAITDGEGNYSLFEYESFGVYTGHYFFNVRGKAARKLSEEMLNHIFKDKNVHLIRGITPLKHLGARWLSRQLGFKSHGVLNTMIGPCELFIQTKDEWLNSLEEKKQT